MFSIPSILKSKERGNTRNNKLTVIREDTQEIEEPVKNYNFDEREINSNIISFFSFKGGVGKSVYAVNLASELALTFTSKRVALVDLNFYNPDIATILKIELVKSKLIKNYFQNSSIEIEDIANKYEGISNIDVFTSDFDLSWVSLLSEITITRFIKELKLRYDYIVIDTHPALDLVSTFIPMKLSNNVVCVITLGTRKKKSLNTSER